MWLLGYGCSTSAGPGRETFWEKLSSGAATATPLDESGLIKNKNEPLPNYFVQLRKDLPAGLSHRERLVRKLKDAWSDAGVAPSARPTGVILASTKGFTEDVIWTSGKYVDTLTPLLPDFVGFTGVKPSRQAVISNACSSVAAALQLAQIWMGTGAVEDVVVVSADTVGEFVLRGFHSLQALTTQNHAAPFDQNRAGLQLGEAAAVLWLSSRQKSDYNLLSVATNSEGVAATRPDEEGRSLYLALSQALKNYEKPEAIVAHGTATPLNDSTEDFVFNALYGEKRRPAITGAKWCAGHTLGASAAVDLIAALGILQTGRIFGLPFLKKVDGKLKGDYVTKARPYSGNSVLVSSLGFGGVHAGLLVAKETER